MKRSKLRISNPLRISSLNSISRSRLIFLFILTITSLYFLLFIYLDTLRFPLTWDEPRFWRVSLSFSQSLIPTLDQLKDYGELNTPLPFIIFGILENLFHGGIFAGRALNLILSFLIICLIGLSRSKKEQIESARTKTVFDSRKHNEAQNKEKIVPMLSVIGLLSFPYYLWLSSHLYTDIIATFFVLIGFWFYVRNQQILSGFAFILAIASRQFMLAFPAAIVAFEVISALQSGSKIGARQFVPLIATSSFFAWLLLFKGLAPSSALTSENLVVPLVQQQLFAIDPRGSLYFLSAVGLYFVIPEWLLFSRKVTLRSLLTKKVGLLAFCLLVLFIIFPPIEAHGILFKVTQAISIYPLKIVFLYTLAVLSLIRFSHLNLAFWVLLANTTIMLKAYPWEKYLLPLLVVFWYLKANGLLDNIRLPSVSQRILNNQGSESSDV